jgi:phosphoribosylanthranilate isomerase
MSVRVRIKVCGLTTVANARAVADLGVDEIGFNFFEPSTRYVDPAIARDIARALPPEIRRVGVFVNAAAADIDRIAGLVGLDRVQLHGEPSRDFCLARSRTVVRAFRSAPELTLEAVAEYRGLPVLLDGFHPGQHGGTGRRADWAMAARIAAAGFELYLAGGLTPENLAEAIATVAPSVVDLNSGVESAPGIKDPDRLAAAIDVVRGSGVERKR